MAKLQAARFITEVAPPKFISVAKRPLKKMLATISEEEKDFGAATERLSSSFPGASSLSLSRKMERSSFFGN